LVGSILNVADPVPLRADIPCLRASATRRVNLRSGPSSAPLPPPHDRLRGCAPSRPCQIRAAQTPHPSCFSKCLTRYESASTSPQGSLWRGTNPLYLKFFLKELQPQGTTGFDGGA